MKMYTWQTSVLFRLNKVRGRPTTHLPIVTKIKTARQLNIKTSLPSTRLWCLVKFLITRNLGWRPKFRGYPNLLLYGAAGSCVKSGTVPYEGHLTPRIAVRTEYTHFNCLSCLFAEDFKETDVNSICLLSPSFILSSRLSSFKFVKEIVLSCLFILIYIYIYTGCPTS